MKLLSVILAALLAIPSYGITGYYLFEIYPDFSWGWKAISMIVWIALGGAPAAFIAAFVAQKSGDFESHEEAFKFLMPFVGATVVIAILWYM